MIGGESPFIAASLKNALFIKFPSPPPPPKKKLTSAHIFWTTATPNKTVTFHVTATLHVQIHQKQFCRVFNHVFAPKRQIEPRSKWTWANSQNRLPESGHSLNKKHPEKCDMIQYHMIKAELQGTCEGSSYCKLYNTYSNKFSEVLRHNLNKVWSGKGHDSWYCSLSFYHCLGMKYLPIHNESKDSLNMCFSKVGWMVDHTKKKYITSKYGNIWTVKHSLMWPHGSTCVSDHPHPFPPFASMSPRWAPSRDRSSSRYPAD